MGGWVLSGLCNLDICADNPHAHRATQRTANEQVTSSDAVDQVQDPHNRDGGLDTAKQTRCQQRSIGACNANALEDSRAVVVDGVDAGSILPHKQHGTNEQPEHVFLAGKGRLDGVPEADANGGAEFLDGLVNGADFFNHVDVVCRQLSDPAQVLDAFLTLAADHQVSWRFADEEYTEKQEARRDQLDSKWDDPLLVAFGECGLHAVLCLLAYT